MRKFLGDWVMDRLQENSTWRGVILIATALLSSAGHHLSHETADYITAFGLLAVGVFNVVRREKVKTK